MYCKSEDTVFHLLFGCERVQKIWGKISALINVDVKWKHIVVGWPENNLRTSAYNIIFSVVTFAIYSAWLKCMNDKTNFKNINLFETVKRSIKFNI